MTQSILMQSSLGLFRHTEKKKREKDYLEVNASIIYQ